MALFLTESEGGNKERTTLYKRTSVPTNNYRTYLNAEEAGVVIRGFSSESTSSSNFYVLPLVGGVGRTLYYSWTSGVFSIKRCGTYFWQGGSYGHGSAGWEFYDRMKMLTEDDDYIWFVPRVMFQYNPSQPSFASNRIERYNKETATYDEFTFSSNTVNNAQTLPSTDINLGIHFIPKDANTLLMVYAVAKATASSGSSSSYSNVKYSNIRICYYEIRCNQSDHTASVWQLDTVHSLSDFTIPDLPSSGYASDKVYSSFKDIDNYVYIAFCRENNARFRECIVNLDTMSVTENFTGSKTSMILGSTIRYKGTSYLAPRQSGVMIPIKVEYLSNNWVTVKADTTKDAILRKPSLYLTSSQVSLTGYLANPEMTFELSSFESSKGQFLRTYEVTPETISSTSVLDLFNSAS